MKRNRHLQEFIEVPPDVEKPVTEKVADTVPYFVTVKGCINCDVCAEHKKKYGVDYGVFDHELMVGCLLRGCDAYRHTICNPFMHPAEIRRMAKLMNDAEVIRKAERIASQIENEFRINGWTV